MSTTAHQVILIKKSDHIEDPLYVLSKIDNTDKLEEDQMVYPVDGHNYYIKKYIFNINPGFAKELLIKEGTDTDKPDIVPDYYKGYHFVSYTLAELEDLAESLFEKYQEEKKLEDVISYVAEYAHRLNIGKGLNQELHEIAMENIEDLYWTARGVDWLRNSIKTIISTNFDGFISDFDIKIIMWNS